MIKVTLEFKSVDEAIIALGKLVGAAPSKAVESTAPVVPVAAAPATPRKGRADKGQKRGSYKNVAAPDGQPPSVIAVPAPVTAPAAAAPVPKPEDVQAALEKLFEKKGANEAIDLLSRFGCKRGRDLLPEYRAEFIAEAGKALT